MTAGQDEARAITEQIRGLVAEFRGGFPIKTITALLAAALTEARIQGACDALKPNPHLDELTALSQEMGLYDTPPALAPLREAVVEAERAVLNAVDRWAKAGTAHLASYLDSNEFSAITDVELTNATSSLGARHQELCAALSRAQPPTTEDLT